MSRAGERRKNESSRNALIRRIKGRPLARHGHLTLLKRLVDLRFKEINLRRTSTSCGTRGWGGGGRRQDLRRLRGASSRDVPNCPLE